MEHKYKQFTMTQ